MKKILLLFTLLILNACISATVAVNTGVNSSSVNDNEETLATQSNPDILVGKHQRKDLEQAPFGSWFNTNYEEYTADASTVEKIAPKLQDISIKAFMGTWCSDSKRETPNFYKILDQAKFDYNNFELITVSRSKETPEGFEKGLNIIRVPTFIFYKEGKEIGRYVEFAQESLEKDILAIVSGEPYKHSYED
ncbi:thioredoxin family protein [Aquimarina sp. D1M17]|uniref:thioredoxin family protein n=1 Tax=Aquimarina acroporae TaxID=2937283 RepID=UPI0020BE32AE|nr:thioredoxin family protein [Aquimarina acroporae]MCK8522158.1 thioredoxin family protein [Aquimarina acroporae]